MQNVKICNHCGQPNRTDALECVQCRHAFRVYLTVSPEPPVFVPVRPADERKPLRYGVAGACFALALCAVLLLPFLSRKRTETPALPAPAMHSQVQFVQPLTGEEASREAFSWAKVQTNQTPVEVLSLIGEPDSRKDLDDGTHVWMYQRGQYYLHLTFDDAGTVQKVQGYVPKTF